MTWKQVIYYYNIGWNAKETEAKIHWGTYGKMTEDSSETPEKKASNPDIEEIRAYPGYENSYYDKKGKLIKG